MSSRSDEGLVGSSHRGSGALVVAAFQSSLDNLLLAATKHRGMNPLRDAVQSTRMKGYIAEDVFHTLVLACNSLHCRRQYRSLLMQSLSDLGKMPSLRMLPMSCNVISVICHLVVKLLGRAPPSGSINVTQSGVWSTTMRGKSVDTLANHSVAAAEGEGGIYFPDIELREGSIDLGGLSVDSVADAQPPDEELQMRILQTLMAYLSACELSNTALSDILSILFVLYIQATPGSMVELTCAATIEERTQALFRCLRSNGDNKAVEDDNTLFTAQIQAVAYAKDVCSLCAQHPTKWLKLNLQRHNSFIVSLPMDTTISGAMNVPPPPRRLRLLLLRTLITHFIESERINSVHETNVFFIQYLNEDIISLVLGRLRASSSSQRETGLEIDEDDNLVDLLSLMDEETNEEEFYLTQHLGVVVISKALPVMRRAMPILLRHHVILVKLSNAEDIAEVAENARRMAVVLKLWSKAIADHELLQELLLITPSTSTFLASRIPHIIQQQQQQQIVEERGGKKKQTSEEESSSSAMTLFRDVFYNQGGGGGNSGGGAMSDGIDSTYPFADLVIMTAEILSNIIIASDGVFNLDHIKSADEKNRPPAVNTSSSSPPLPPPVASTIGGSHWTTLSTAFSRPLRFTNPTMKTTTTTTTTTAPTAVAAAGGQDRESVENLPSERGLVSDVEERHPATRHTADILSFLTMFTQSFSRVIEVSKLGNAASRNVINNNNDNNNNNVVGAAPTVVNTEEEVRALFILLHSSLFHCFSLAAKHLRGDDVIHMILKGITHLIHASCTLGLSAERDSYLQIFVTRLNMPQEEQLYSLEGKFVETTTIQPKYKDVKEHTSSLSSSPSPIKTTKLVEVVGGGNVSVIKPPQHMARRTSAFRQSLNALQEKLYVLNCVISVANCMGPSLGEGWAPVTSCLLLTEPLLKDFHTLVEQQQQQRQYKRGAIDEITLQDALRNADRVRDALYILFINSALLPDTVALEGLLKNFVSQTCKRPPSEYLLSLRMTSECCALSLITIAACRLDVSLSCLWRLWCTVKPLYLHVFDPVTIVQLVHFCSHSNRKMEVVAGTLERLVEDIAVVTAQLCQRLNNNNNNNNNSGCEEKRSKSQGNRKEEEVEGKDDVLTFRFAAGPYATAPLVSRLVSLCPTPRRIRRDVFHVDPHVYKKGGNVLVDANYNENNEAQSRPILASTTELLATIYVYLQQHQHRQRKPKEQPRHDEEENSSVSLSQQARQQQQEEEQEQEEEEEDEEEKQMSESVKTVTRGVSLVLLKEVSKLVQGFGEDLRGAAWEHLLRLLRHTTTSPSRRMRKKNNDGNSNNNNTLCVTTPLASAQQSISIAFRTLETIQHSCITSLDDEGLRQLIRCGGAFMVHHSPGFEHRLNINLSSVQLLWSIADYVVTRENGNEKNNDLLWCTLLMQLYDGCLDVRPEVRQSALKTLFSLLQTYAGRLSAECWRCALIAVFIPLMDVSILGADTCIVSADAPAVSSTLSSRRCSAISQRLRRRSSESVSTATISESVQTLYDGYTNEEEWHIATLLTHLGKHPTLFEDMRVTIMDAISRVFASHYQAMYAALVLQCEDLHQRTDGEALLHEVLALFIKLCGTSRYVVKTTTGESAALSAVRALHLLMTVTEPVLMTEGEFESAWFEIERLLRRDNDCQHTERKQCTAAVVTSIVTSLGDVVALRITGNKRRQQQSEGGGITTTTTTAAAANSMGPPLTSSPSTLLQHLYHAFSPSPTRIINTDDSTRHDYFPDYLRIMQDSLCSFAVVESYFFPGRVQTAVIEVWKTLWPLLDGHERGAIVSIALQQFPARHSITAFLAQGEVGAVVSSPTKKRRETVVRIAELSQSSTTIMQQQQKEDEEPSSSSHKQQQQQSISLSEIVPPTSHPNFLLALMDFLCRVGEEEKLEQLYVKRMMHIVAPSVIRVIGALLLLEYASPALLAVPGPRLPVHIPNDFFDKAERCFTFFLLEVLWDETSTATLSGTSTPVPRLGVAYDPSSSLSMNRREGLLAFAFTFSTLVSHANLQIDVIERERRAQTVVGGGESGASTCNVAPENLRSAFQRLERFVIILNDLIPDVIRRTGDVSTATELLSALVPSSSLESPLFAAVAKRSLDVLRTWSLHTCDHGSISTEKETLMSVTQKQPKDGKSDASEANNSRQPSEDAKKLMTATTRKVGGENDDHDNDGVSCGKGKELSSRLKNVARASMGARNQVVLRKFLSNTANEDTRQMMKTTLQTLVLLYPPRADTQQAESKRRLHGTMPLSKEHVDTLNKSSGDDSDETAEGVKVLQGILMDLARLVEHTGDDRELQPLLSRAMLGICASLGFSSS